MEYLIHHMLESSASRLPDKEALVDKDIRGTFQIAVKKVTGLADGLRQAGLRRGERVGIHLDTAMVQALSIFGVSQAGGVFVPINSALFPQQVAHIARDCQMRGLITTTQKLSSLVPVLMDVPSREFLMVTGEKANTEIRKQLYE